MKEQIKKLCSAMAWLVCRLLPVQANKIVVSNYYGRGYGDNPKAIVDALLKRGERVKIVWLTDGEHAAASLPAGVEACPYQSIRRIYELSTAKVWIDNCRKGARFKRKNQIYLQTWHGFALKRIERDAADKLPPDYPAYAARDAAQTDLIVSDSQFMTEVYQRSFWYNGEVLIFGAPRNDLLCKASARPIEKVRTALGIPADSRIILYAPTFRADGSLDAYDLDYARLRQSCKARFGGRFSVAIRLHPNVAKKAGALHYDGDTTFNASPYEDMQELLAASDVVVTDYSSLMFDFLLTRRPCFQFAVDIEQYRSDRNFYLPLDTLPFPLATSNDELAERIAAFDETAYASDIDRFIADVGLCTDGVASERCADWLTNKMKG